MVRYSPEMLSAVCVQAFSQARQQEAARRFYARPSGMEAGGGMEERSVAAPRKEE